MNNQKLDTPVRRNLLPIILSVCLISGLLVTHNIQKHSEAVRLSVASFQAEAFPAARRALELTNHLEMGNDKATLEPGYNPTSRIGCLTDYGRELYEVSCQANQWSYNYLFDTKSGELRQLTCDPIETVDCDNPRIVTPVVSGSQAAKIAVRRLHQLNLIHKGDTVAMIGKPVWRPLAHVWKMNLTTSGKKSPRRLIRVILSQYGGYPLFVTDIGNGLLVPRKQNAETASKVTRLTYS